MVSRQPTRAEIEAARKRLGLDRSRPQTTGFSAALAEPEEEPSGRGIPGTIAAGFRAAVPQGVRDAGGALFDFIDTPLSERAGFRIPDDPLFFDEVGNFVLQEATRPSTALIALGGAGAAGQLSRLGTAGRIAAGFVAPAGGNSLVSRAVAETALGVGARGAGEAANKALPEDTPTGLRIALNLGAAALGGVGTLAATRQGARAAFRRDVLAPNLTPRIKQTEADVVPRKGNLLSARVLDNPTIDDVLDEARSLSRATESTATQLRASVESISRPLGKRVKDADGQTIFAGIRKNDGSRAIATEVLEFPDRFRLTPEHRHAVDQIQDVIRTARAEAELFGAGIKDAELEIGQGFIPRRALTDTKGVDVSSKPRGSGSRLAVSRQRSRTYSDPAEGAAAGVVYDDPIESVSLYVKNRLTDSANAHVKSLLEPWSETSAIRVPAGLRAQHDGLAQRLNSLKATYGRLDSRVQTTVDSYLNAAEPNLDNLFDDLSGIAPRGAKAPAAPSPKRVFMDEAQASGNPVRTPTVDANMRVLEAAASSTPLELTGFRQVRGTPIKGTGTFYAVNPMHAGSYGGDVSVTGPIRSLNVDRLRLNNPLVVDGGHAAARRELFRLELQRGPGASERTRAMAQALNNVERNADSIGETGFALLDKAIAAAAQRLGFDGIVYRKATSFGQSDLPINTTEVVVFKPNAKMSVPAASGSGLLQDLGDITVRGSGRNAGKNLSGIAQEIEAVKAEIDLLRPDWRRALERSRAIPAGRRGVPIEIAPALAGRDFPEDVAKRVERFYSRGRLPNNQIGTAVKGVQAVNRTLIPLQAMGDMSSLLNQLITVLPSNPRVFFRNMGLATRDAFSPTHYDDWLRENAENAARRGVVIMRGGAEAVPEFTLSGWLARAQGFKQAQKFFDASTTRNRVDLFNQFVDVGQRSGKVLTNVDEDRLARSLNRLTGISNSRAGDVETLATFAPNFLRAGIETIVKAATDGTIEGSLARQYMRNLVIAGQVTAIGAAMAQGRDPREVALPITINTTDGKVYMNPNFGTVRIPGINQDVSLYGRFDSLARLAVVGMDAAARAITEQDAMELFDAVGFLASSKGSPGVSFGTSLVTGTTFGGDDPLSAAALSDRLLPFAISGFVQDVRSEVEIKTALGGAAINFFGGKSRELTAFEELNNIAVAEFGKTWDNLTGQEKQRIDATFPALVKRTSRQQELAAKRGDVKAQSRIEFAKIDALRVGDERKVAQAYQVGDIDTRQYAEALDELQRNAAVQKDQVLRTLGVEFGDPSSGPNRALSAYFSTFDEATIAPGVIDWDVRDKLEQELTARIERGEFGDPAEARRAIDERKVVQHAAEVETYFAAKKLIGESGYYDTLDEEFTRFARPASTVAGTALQTYGDLLKAIRRAEVAGDASMQRRLEAIGSQVEKRSSAARQRLRLRNPELDEALVIAKGLTPIRQQEAFAIRLP